MGNHYHLAVVTPEGNLVTGMHWLHATFASRFNRLRKQRGHLVQGRYKALRVEPGVALGKQCPSIDLNPARNRGWALGSDGFTWDMRQEHRLAAVGRACFAQGVKELREARPPMTPVSPQPSRDDLLGTRCHATGAAR